MTHHTRLRRRLLRSRGGWGWCGGAESGARAVALGAFIKALGVYAQSCSSESESVDHFTVHVVCHTPRKVLSLFLSDHTATATSRFGSISPDLPALVLTVTRTPDSAQDQTLQPDLFMD
ncbi:hypothetical protein JB92DRAFT_2903204 [Gautieria morchelliformis]|nr:hypothetical protein JB92DRAFT_2903204 [Gautieria morchelliformis]